MIVVISGTPATGKTSAGKELKKLLGAKLISISDLIARKRIASHYDRKRDTKVVRERDIKKAVAGEIEKGGANIVEGHAAHILKADYVFVLRCRPPALLKRMKGKAWTKEKVTENLEAELLDTIAIEAVEVNKKRVYEIDTSVRTEKQTAALIKKIIGSNALQKKYRAGKIDWTERYRKYFTARDYDMTA